jgi:hypothetical protein
MAGAPGFEPGNGGIKSRVKGLIYKDFMRSCRTFVARQMLKKSAMPLTGAVGGNRSIMLRFPENI